MVEISYNEVEKEANEESIIQSVVQTVLKLEKIKHSVDVYITLTNNEEIHKINKEYREVDRPTDVLSFPMYEREDIEKLREEKTNEIEEILGDIIISIPKVKEQAEEYGHSYERELAYLTTHGMVHLLGYDHLDEGEQKAQMRSREEAIASTIARMQRD